MDDPDRRRPTRRRFLRNGGAVAVTGLLAGCRGDGGDSPSSEPTSAGDPTTGTPTESTAAATDSAPATDATTSYSVSMAPVGEVALESVPETWVANNGSWADMGAALGLEPPKGVWLTSRYHTQYYDAIPGVSVDTSDMVSLSNDGVSKELLYDLDGDVHVIDPNFLVNRFDDWDESDVAEIRTNVAPFFGNCIYAQHYPWHDDYRYYTLAEGFEKLAQLFQRIDRYEAMMGVREDFQANVESIVPSGEGPEVAVLWGVGDEPAEFYPYVIGGGTGFKHFRDLGVRDALANSDITDFHASRAAIDLETVLEIDPEVLMLRGYETKSRQEFQDTLVSFLQDHQTASALTAVENGDVYRAGGLYQGPITNMVVTERTARQLYGVDEDLFDRERTAAVVNGEI